MLLTYKNFWPSFQEDEEMFQRLFDDPLFQEIDQIELESVFHRKLLPIGNKAENFLKSQKWASFSFKATDNKHKLKKSIWYTGENVRPPFPNNFDLTLSFDQDRYSGKNVYLPLFYLRLLFPTESSIRTLGVDVSKIDLTQSRESDWADREKFACTFINNPEPTRLRAVEALSSIGQVDVYGKHSGRIVDNKFSVASGYKFSICFENSIHPGYITEKLLDAYVCGSIPIYWGDVGENSILNRKAFFNYRDFESLESLASHIDELPPKQLEEMSKEPLLLKRINLRTIREEIYQALNSN
jgi:hypothetical protein